MVADGATEMAAAYLSTQAGVQVVDPVLRRVYFCLLGAACLMNVACTRIVADSSAAFNVSGIVKDESGQGIGGVEIYFVDSGLEMSRAASNRQIPLGQTSSAGEVRASFEHHWGRFFKNESTPKGPQGSFELHFSHPKFPSVSRTYRLADLPFDEHAFRVTVDVVMQRRSKS